MHLCKQTGGHVQMILCSTYHFVRGDLPKLVEHFFQFVIGQIITEILDVDIGKLLGLLSQLLLPLLAGDESADEDFLLVQQHAVDLLDGVHGGLFGLEMDESVSLAGAVTVLSDLAGQDVSEGREGVVHSLVVN